MFHNGVIVPSLSYKILGNGNVFFGTCNEDGDMHGENVLHLYYTNDEYKDDLFYGNLVNGERIEDGDYEKSINPNGWGWDIEEIMMINIFFKEIYIMDFLKVQDIY